MTITGAPADVAAMLAALALGRQLQPELVEPTPEQLADVVQLDGRRRGTS